MSESLTATEADTFAPGQPLNRVFGRHRVDVGGGIDPIPPYCSICSSAEIDL
jgi:hypothetical protein